MGNGPSDTHLTVPPLRDTETGASTQARTTRPAYKNSETPSKEKKNKDKNARQGKVENENIKK